MLLKMIRIKYMKIQHTVTNCQLRNEMPEQLPPSWKIRHLYATEIYINSGYICIPPVKTIMYKTFNCLPSLSDSNWLGKRKEENDVIRMRFKYARRSRIWILKTTAVVAINAKQFISSLAGKVFEKDENVIKYIRS